MTRQRPIPHLIWCLPALVLGLIGCGKGYRDLTLTELEALYVAVPSEPLPALTSSPLGTAYRPSGTVLNWKASTPIQVHTMSGYDQPKEAVGTISPAGMLSMHIPLQALEESARPLSKTFWGQATDTRYCGIHQVKLSRDPEVRWANLSYGYLLKDVETPPRNGTASGLTPQTSPTYPPPKYGGIQLASVSSEKVVSLLWTPEDVTVQAETQCISGREQVNGARNVIQDKLLLNLKLSRGWNALVKQDTKESTAPNGVHLYTVIWSAYPAEQLMTWKSY